jgi:hypothetical protein
MWQRAPQKQGRAGAGAANQTTESEPNCLVCGERVWNSKSLRSRKQRFTLNAQDWSDPCLDSIWVSLPMRVLHSAGDFT